MRHVLIAAAMIMLSFATATQAGPAEEIRAVIEDQVEAFRADDGARAFSHASESIQTRFGNPDNFMEMVRTGYPQVYRPRAMEFQTLQESGSLVMQEVFYFGEAGGAVVARYFMQKNTSGVWKITGVDLRKAPELGA
jgi:hypothetical protein